MMRCCALFLLCYSSVVSAQQTGALGNRPDWHRPDRDACSLFMDSQRQSHPLQGSDHFPPALTNVTTASANFRRALPVASVSALTTVSEKFTSLGAFLAEMLSVV